MNTLPCRGCQRAAHSLKKLSSAGLQEHESWMEAEAESLQQNIVCRAEPHQCEMTSTAIRPVLMVLPAAQSQPSISCQT